MRLSELLKNVKTEKSCFDSEITSICTDSRKAVSGCAFFCMNGRNHNSAYHAKEALEKGAAVIISEKRLDYKNAVRTDNIETALSRCCDNFYGNPSEKLRLLGVTGTNGKTSVAYMIKHILEFSGGKAGMLGTTGNLAGRKKLFETGFTTPEPAQMYSLFDMMVKENAAFCVMEASSQSLSQGRCAGLNFETAVFTNLTKEHLDYHGDMKSYAKAKSELLRHSRKCVLNLDDEYYGYFSAFCKTALTYSVKNSGADLFAKDIKLAPNKVSYTLVSGGEYRVEMNVSGIFNVSNSLAAIGCCVFSGISIEKCAEALKSFGGVSGRAETLKTGTPFTVMTDYAHTPDAIKNILSSVRTYTGGRVISLFGCGGNRDRKKRPLMARTAAENSDFVVITSDNPRNENPYFIIKEILKGLDGCDVPFAVIENRREAIKFALNIAEKCDAVILCGKGHEEYQIIGNEKIPFDEKKIVYDILHSK